MSVKCYPLVFKNCKECILGLLNDRWGVLEKMCKCIGLMVMWCILMSVCSDIRHTEPHMGLYHICLNIYIDVSISLLNVHVYYSMSIFWMLKIPCVCTWPIKLTPILILISLRHEWEERLQAWAHGYNHLLKAYCISYGIGLLHFEMCFWCTLCFITVSIAGVIATAISHWMNVGLV